MITGHVTAHHEAVVPLKVKGPGSEGQDVSNWKGEGCPEKMTLLGA